MNLFHSNSNSPLPARDRQRQPTFLAALGSALFLLAFTPVSIAQDNTPSPSENPTTAEPLKGEPADPSAGPPGSSQEETTTAYFVEDAIAFDDEAAAESARAIYEAERTIGFQMLVTVFGGLLAGILFVIYCLPRLANLVASFFYGPREKVAPKPNWLAVEKIGQGDYVGAIAEYRKLMKKQPTLLFPVTEVAKLYVENLDDPDAAVDFLEKCLRERQWPVADTASLMFRVVEIELEQRSNLTRARELLTVIAENFKGTRHAANAKHKIEEIDAIVDTKDTKDTKVADDTEKTKDAVDTAEAKDVGESKDGNQVDAKVSAKTP